MTYVQPTGGGSTISVRNAMVAQAMVGGIETPSTLPALAYSAGVNHALSSPITIAAFKVSLEAAVKATSNSWRYLDGYNNGGTQRAILIGGPTGSPVEDMRILIALGSAAPANRVPNCNPAVNAPYVGLAPDAGSTYDLFSANGEGAAGNVGDPFAVGNPFGVARYSGMAFFANDITANAIHSIHIFESLETLTICLLRGIYLSVAHVGATVKPPNDTAAEADGRIYGLHTTGLSVMQVAGTQANDRFPGHSGNSLSDCAGLFTPAVPATFSVIEKSFGINAWAGILNWSNTPSGPLFGIPIPMKITASGQGFGWMRQMTYRSDCRHGLSDPGSDGMATSFALCRSEEDPSDAVCLLNIDNEQTPPDALPKLTFSWGAAQALGVTTSISSYKTAVKAAVQATTNSWRYLDGYNNGGTQRAALIGGPIGSPVEDMRIIVAIGNAAPANLFANTNVFNDGPYMAMSPDAGSGYDAFATNSEADGIGGTAGVTDPFAAANPFGTARFTGFALSSHVITSNAITSVRAVDSLETLAILGTRGTGTTISLAGATVTPPNADAAEPDGRLYGLHTSGQDIMVTNFNNLLTKWPGHNQNTFQDSSGVFNPASPTVIALLERGSTAIYAGILNFGTTPSGPKFGLPLAMKVTGEGLSYGWMRQLFVYNDANHDVAITDKDAVTVGRTISRDTASSNDAYALLDLTNSP
jgi:hypothetical protein